MVEEPHHDNPDTTEPPAPGEVRAPRRRVIIPLTLDRRTLIRGGGAVIATATVGGLATSCDIGGNESSETAQDIQTNVPEYSNVPNTPMTPPPAGILRVFSPHEAATVDALTARIMPGDANDPGAHEAGVVDYIDFLLATNDGLAEATYREAPYAQVYSPQHPQASPAVGAYQTIWVAADQIKRYGYQSILTPREVYRIGIAAVDRYAMQTFGKQFVDLGEQQQDQMIGDMAQNKITSFDPSFSAQSFFQNLRRHTAEGMFSDPVYGGNRNMVGWKLVGFPGAQRAYMPDEYQREGTNRQPQGIAEMMHFNPGQPARDDDNVIYPVSGSDPSHGHDHGSHP
ncbi:MAG: gluconate 2-dehydrogenase subunit 3 family protein [Thermomicrobiales bacterium]